MNIEVIWTGDAREDVDKSRESHQDQENEYFSEIKNYIKGILFVVALSSALFKSRTGRTTRSSPGHCGIRHREEAWSGAVNDQPVKQAFKSSL